MAQLVAPLFVPGDRPERFTKAANTGTDAVIIDLEDAVAPADKPKARSNAERHGLDPAKTIIRINAATSVWFEDDLGLAARLRLRAIMLPKAEGKSQIDAIRVRAPRTPVIALIESARGVAALSETLRADGVEVAAFGPLDLALDLGCTPIWEAMLHARSEVVLRSRLAGLAQPLDGPSPSIKDPIVVEEEARRAASIGFGGKLAIHPAQIAPIRSALLPDTATIAWAERVMEGAVSGAAVQIDGGMIDRPVIERARRILERRSNG